MKIAMMAPQGCFVQKDDLYSKMQGKTTEDGGQVTYVLHMAEELAKRGNEVHIYARGYHREGFKAGQVEVEEHPTVDGVKTFYISTNARDNELKEHYYSHYQEDLAQTIDFIDKNNLTYDHIQGHYVDGMAKAAFISAYLEEKTGNSVAKTGVAHSLGHEKLASRSNALMASASGANGGLSMLMGDFLLSSISDNNFLTRLGVEHAVIPLMDGMVTLSSAHNNTLIDAYNYSREECLSRVPGGYYPEVFHPAESKDPEHRASLRRQLAEQYPMIGQKVNLEEKKIIVGFGRLLEEKGPHAATEAMGDVLRNHPDAIYIYIGGNFDGQDEKEQAYHDRCMRIAQQGGYADKIFFPGKRQQPQIADWLRVSDVYLHTGSPEPFGMVIIESAACRIPVVMSREAGACDDLLHGVHARHIDPHNSADIAREVNWVFANPKKAAMMADQAYRDVKTHCPWETRARYMKDFMSEINGRFQQDRAYQQSTQANKFAGFAARELFSPVADEGSLPRIQKAREIMAQAFRQANGFDVPEVYLAQYKAKSNFSERHMQ